MDTNLISKRQETKEEILSLSCHIPSGRILYFLGGFFQKGVPKENFLFWLSNYVLLSILVGLPGLLLSSLTHELDDWRRNPLLWTLGVQTPVFALLASYIVTKGILKDITAHVIGKISSIEDLDILRNNLKHSFSIRYVLPYSVFAWLAWGIAVIFGISLLNGRFIGWGPSYAAIAAGALIGIAFYYLVWSSQIPIHLGNLEYELNSFMPANSELIGKLTGMFSKYLYILAFVFAILTLEMSLMKEMLVLSFFPIIGWIVIATQFLINRSTIKKIVDLAKWRTLNQIQHRMNHIQKSCDLSEKDTADALLRLADIYQRVFANNISSLDIRTTVTFFSQMMLPLLGMLLANLDRLLKLTL